MAKVFMSQLNIPFIPIDDIYSVIEGIVRHDADDSFMFHFIPNDVVIETGFRRPHAPDRQSFTSYRAANQAKEKWVLREGHLPRQDVYEIVGWEDIKQGYTALLDGVAQLETKKYTVTEFSMGLMPHGCEVKLHVEFPNKGKNGGKFTLVTKHQDRTCLSSVLCHLVKGIPLYRSEHGGYKSLPIDDWS